MHSGILFLTLRTFSATGGIEKVCKVVCKALSDIVQTEGYGKLSVLSMYDKPVDIDNTPPTFSAVGTPQIVGDKARVLFEASDSASFLNRAEYSVNGSDWQAVFADDGISDSPKERYTLEIPLKTAGEYTIALRVFDANGNVGSARVIVKK